MAAYYNEHDPFAAAWLRKLISAGHIAPGDVDERSIEDVQPDDIRQYTQCHFFAGIGIWSHALRSAGWSDEQTIWTGSCPCQPFSAAGKGGGFDDERHLWPAWSYLIQKHKPPIVLGEQVASTSGLEWFDLVHSDMENAGYAVGAADLCAAGVGAPHIRQRLWWVAYSERDKQPRQESCSGKIGRVGRQQQPIPWNRAWTSALAEFRVLDDGYPRCVGGTDAFRNAIVAPVAQAFIESVMSIIPPEA